MRVFFFCIGCAIFGLGASVHDALQTIPEQDLVVLDRFFRCLLYENEFGYTLFGQKPISMTIALFEPSLKEPLERLTFEKGWEMWVRYRHLFPSDRFVLKKDVFGDNRNVTISLINKPMVYKEIVENLAVFRKFLGEQSTETIFQKICSGDKSIFDLTSPHPQALVGILLGYGKLNALNFQRDSEIFEGLNRQLPPLAPDKISLSPVGMGYLKGCAQPRYTLKTKAPSFPTILKGMKEIFEVRQGFLIGDYVLERFDSPKFACWDNEETVLLRESYKKTRVVLREIYKKGSFLENTLNQWTSPNEFHQDVLIAESPLRLQQR